MAELPEDVPRRRMILAHVERQIAENETINTYLSLQLAEVRQALARAEQRDRP
ncbi:hypothetical protein GTW40_27555 [Streptomyces sp. SID4985]|uniref:hypothetical protein n=1 Tax=Streptomyces sp. SID4985 TaxID=2690292 RepID=UPI001367F2E3|nr:hypothetical protein [Streptomyces sp. SID4985]MYQ48745.1 hypothetical protein [Streptomyces sp. SID4985]